MGLQHQGIIRRFDRYDYDGKEIAFTDLLLVLTGLIEDALIEAGATPGKDYDFKALFGLANPYAVEMVRTNKPVRVRVDVSQRET